MTFEEAAQHYTTLRQQRDFGQLPDATFRQMVAQLVVADAQGNYWQLDPDTTQWVPYVQAAVAPQVTAEYPQGNAYAGAIAAPAYAQAANAQPAPGQPQAEKSRGLPQSTWDVISVVGNAILSAAWYLYSGMAETKPDYLTCGAMLVLPISFIVFRKPLDGLLRSIQPLRSKIPSMVLAGCCVAVPYLVANYLFAFGVRQFHFMFCSYVLSTVASFILLRQPSGGPSKTNPPGMAQQAGVMR